MPSIESPAIYENAKGLVIQSQNPSIALLQRRLKLTYSQALALMGALEANNVVTPLDNHGYRRLSPEHERTSTEVFNNWREFSNTEDSPLEGALVDVSHVVAAIRPYSATYIAFHRESGLPWIELAFLSVIKPQTVITIGIELEYALQMPVYMANLQLRKVEYLVEGNLLLRDDESYADDHFKSVRLSMPELAKAWDIPISREI